MTDYIDRQAAIDALEREQSPIERPITEIRWFDLGLRKAQVLLSKLPSAEVEPVKHGRWLITEAYPHRVYCSKCYKTYAQTSWAVWEDGSLPRKYCPNCGARMDAEGE